MTKKKKKVKKKKTNPKYTEKFAIKGTFDDVLKASIQQAENKNEKYFMQFEPITQQTRVRKGDIIRNSSTEGIIKSIELPLYFIEFIDKSEIDGCFLSQEQLIEGNWEIHIKQKSRGTISL